MVDEVRVYVEGGGQGETRARFRRAYSMFLQRLLAGAERTRGKNPMVIACGSRNETYDHCRVALREHPLAFNVLLVDAEDAVPERTLPKTHLARRDRWDLSGFADEQCHLMVQMMEAWFLADPDALQAVYGPRLNRAVLPSAPNVEDVPKPQIETALKAATLPTPAKEYHKTRDGPRILERLDVT